MAKTSTNLTLHQRIRELAEQLQSDLGYGSLSTLVEDLIRQEYERRNGQMKLEERPEQKPPPGPPPGAPVKPNPYPGRIAGQGNSHRRRKQAAAQKRPAPSSDSNSPSRAPAAGTAHKELSEILVPPSLFETKSGPETKSMHPTTPAASEKKGGQNPR